MTVVIAAGGTGGHLYPAIALAHEFQRQDPAAVVRFVGTDRGIEGKVLPHEGFPLHKITARPLMGRGVGRAAAALLALPVGIWQSIKVLRAHRADLVVGIGGYTTPPVLAAACLLGIPRVILEPNAYAGVANRALGPLATLVFLAFEAAGKGFPPSKIRVVGTPIRRAFLEPTTGGDTVWTSSGSVAPGSRKRLLVFGGSQGAQAINTAMIEALPELKDLLPGLEVVHQTGPADAERVKVAYAAAGMSEAARVEPFLFEMPKWLRAADLVVSRAGAVTLAELTACGKPAVLIPLPHAIYDHQARNARVMEEAGAAVVLRQEALSGATLASTIRALLGDPERLRQMGLCSQALARPQAAGRIVEECVTLLKQKGGARRREAAG